MLCNGVVDGSGCTEEVWKAMSVECYTVNTIEARSVYPPRRTTVEKQNWGVSAGWFGCDAMLLVLRSSCRATLSGAGEFVLGEVWPSVCVIDRVAVLSGDVHRMFARVVVGCHVGQINDVIVSFQAGD